MANCNTAVEADELLLPALPDPCLLAVMQCLAADDQRSLCSAARAHSRLHQAAVLALRSITAVAPQSRQVDDVLLYLSKYRQQVESVSIEYTGVQDHRPFISLCVLLQASAQLRSWQLINMSLPGHHFQGMLVPTLTKLRLSSCKLHGGVTAAALAAALSQLPGLEHLSLRGLTADGRYYVLPAGVLQQLQQLTYLELDTFIEGPDDDSLPLQPLQALTRLCDLRLRADTVRVTASMLSGAHLLTRLDLACWTDAEVEPAILAGKTRLQHLKMVNCAFEDAAELTQLLSQLQQLQQLTHLDLTWTLGEGDEGRLPPAAAYAALTASSKLQHLNISACALPAGVWQHVLPAGRLLPQLRELNITGIAQSAGGDVGMAPEGSRLVSCCPGLQSLEMRTVQYSTELLAPLQGLSALHTLRMGHSESAGEEHLLLVCQLTGLRELGMGQLGSMKGQLVLQLTQLKQLTALTYDADDIVSLGSQGPGDEPVWRQLLRRHLSDSDPDVAQQAATALAE